MVYIASYALHRSKRSGLVKCHSRRRVCIVCGGKCRILQLNKSTKNTTFFNLFYYRVLGYLFIIQTKKLFFRLLFCTLVHMVYIASPAHHRSKRSGLVKCHSGRRVCVMCGGKWVEWDVTVVQYGVGRQPCRCAHINSLLEVSHAVSMQSTVSRLLQLKIHRTSTRSRCTCTRVPVQYNYKIRGLC